MGCSYCEKEIASESKYNVCDECMTSIVLPLKRKGKGKNGNAFKEFKKKVWELTEFNAKQLEGIENRGWKKDHIDHKFSIYQGFKEGKTIEQLASLENLRMLNYKENMVKGIKCV